MTSITTEPKPAAVDPSSGFVDFLLAQFRVARLRAQIVSNELETMSVALSAGLVTPETALLHLHEIGAMELLPESSG